MRLFAAFISMLSLSACNASPADRASPRDIASATPTKLSEPAPLLINQNRDVLVLTAFAKGRLNAHAGCIVFSTTNGEYTAIWPGGTRWSEDFTTIILPTGVRMALDTPVTLPGGHMGSRRGSDLKPNPIPVPQCPDAFFGVHPN